MEIPGSMARIASHRGAQQRVEAKRTRVTLFFQNEVDHGRARWKTNSEGQTELHLKTGEVFLLRDTALTRLK
jgi:hypothetical protein